MFSSITCFSVLCLLIPARADALHVQLLAHDDADERDLAARGQIVLRFHIPARRL
jgi:hypothetical protein